MPQSELSQIGALLLERFKTEGNETEPYYDVTGLFIPIYSSQEAFNGNLFFSTEAHVDNLILSAIVSIIRKYEDSGPNSEKN